MKHRLGRHTMIPIEVWVAGYVTRAGEECWLCPLTTHPEVDFETQCRIEW